MAITFGGSGSSGPTVASLAVTIPDTGGNSILWVEVGSQDATSATCSVDETGDSMTRVYNTGDLAVFYITGLPAGDYTISGSSLGAKAMMAYDVHFGVDRDNPLGSSDTDSSSSTSTVTFASEEGQVGIDFVAAKVGNLAPGLTADSEQTVIVDDDNGACGAGISCPSLGISTEAGAASVSMSWDCSQTMYHYGVAMRPATVESRSVIRYVHQPETNKMFDVERGAEIYQAEVETDSFMFVPEPFIPIASQPSDNIEDVFVTYNEARVDRGSSTFKATKETFLEALLGGLAES